MDFLYRLQDSKPLKSVSTLFLPSDAAHASIIRPLSFSRSGELNLNPNKILPQHKSVSCYSECTVGAERKEASLRARKFVCTKQQRDRRWTNDESTTVLIVNMKPVCFVCGVDVLGSTWHEWNHAAVMNKRSAADGAFRDVIHNSDIRAQRGFKLTATRKPNNWITIYIKYWSPC